MFSFFKPDVAKPRKKLDIPGLVKALEYKRDQDGYEDAR
jgi:hypothetical protein